MKKNRKRWYPEEGIPGKFLRKMKLILFLCWAGMMQVSAMSYAQTGTVSIRVKETALHEIFQLIEAQCGYTFVYNNEQLNGLKPVSIEMTDAKISKVLDECLKGTDLRYELLDQIIVINRVALFLRLPSICREPLKTRKVIRCRVFPFLLKALPSGWRPM